MDKKEAMDIIDRQWIRKPKGYRIHFQKKQGGQWQDTWVPDNENEFYDSDVVAWRVAWKLSEAAKSDNGELDMVNIYVVDDAGTQITYYATGDYQVFNRLMGNDESPY